MKKKMLTVLIGTALTASLLTGCQKKEEPKAEAPAAEAQQEEAAQEAVVEVASEFESEDGWKISYDPEKFTLNDSLGEGEVGFVYNGECSGTTALFISYAKGKMPDEALYEKVQGYDDNLVYRSEGYYGNDNYWAHFRSINPENEDPQAGDVVYDGFTGIEHNGGTVIIEHLEHKETDDKIYNEIMNAFTELQSTFELVNHEPQTEYAYMVGSYDHEYTDEIGGEKVTITENITLNDDHTCSVLFQDEVAGEWTGTTIFLNDTSRYEFTIEGDTLLLNKDGQWVPFERQAGVNPPLISDMEKYESLIAGLGADQYYAFACVSPDSDVLLITDGVYDYGDGVMAAIDAVIYNIDKDGKIIEAGKVECGGTAYPLSVFNDTYLMTGGNHEMTKSYVEGDSIFTKESASEEFDEKGNATYHYYNQDENFDGNVEDDSKLTAMFDDFNNAVVISFTKAK